MKEKPQVLDPMPDPETIGSPLDMSRPELAPIAERYAPVPSPPPQRPAGTALIVDRAGWAEDHLREALEEEGWAVASCPGPAVQGCPLRSGEDCTIRHAADIAVVYVDPRETSPGGGTLPRLLCAAHSASPAIIAVEGSFQPPRFGDGKATVGALRAPEVVLDTIHKLQLDG